MAQETSYPYQVIYTLDTSIEDVLSDPLVIPIEEGTDIRHTATRPFCVSDSTCPCHEDTTLIATVLLQVAEGLLTLEEATRMVKGEML